MMVRRTPRELRSIAAQLEAPPAIKDAGGCPPGRVIPVDGQPAAFVCWRDDAVQYRAEFLDFHPDGARLSLSGDAV